jgi:predicted ThiF/HesA family dinucleotide-utilizing enzyme
MRVALITVMALPSLGACSAANDAADTIARDRAKSVVNSVVAQKMPGLNAAPVTDCIIDAASAGEIVSIAGASVTGVTPSLAEDVLTIAQRPEAVQCIAQNSMTVLNG